LTVHSRSSIRGGGKNKEQKERKKKQMIETGKSLEIYKQEIGYLPENI